MGAESAEFNRQERPGVYRCATVRLFTRRGQGNSEGLCRDRPGHSRVREVYCSLHYGESAVELAEVSVWRIVWDDAVGGSGGGAAERWDRVQWCDAAVVDFELQPARPGAGL